MKRILLFASATVLAYGVQAGDMDGANTEAGKVVKQYLEYAWGENKNPEGVEALRHPDMVSHPYLGGPEFTENGMGGALMGPGGAPQGGPQGQGAPQGQGGPQGGPPPSGENGAPPQGGGGPGTITPVKMVVQGDLVFVLAHGQRPGSDNGDLAFHLYRVKDGKIIEYWHTQNEIPDSLVGTLW